MTSISICTPLISRNNAFMNTIEKYTWFGGNVAEIADNEGTLFITTNLSTTWTTTALKVTTMILSLGILPLIALMIKAIRRCCYKISYSPRLDQFMKDLAAIISKKERYHEIREALDQYVLSRNDEIREARDQYILSRYGVNEFDERFSRYDGPRVTFNSNPEGPDIALIEEMKTILIAVKDYPEVGSGSLKIRESIWKHATLMCDSPPLIRWSLEEYEQYRLNPLLGIQ